MKLTSDPEFLGLFTIIREPQQGFCDHCRVPLVPPSYRCIETTICLECAVQSEKEVAESQATMNWLLEEMTDG